MFLWVKFQCLDLLSAMYFEAFVDRLIVLNHSDFWSTYKLTSVTDTLDLKFKIWSRIIRWSWTWMTLIIFIVRWFIYLFICLFCLHVFACLFIFHSFIIHCSFVHLFIYLFIYLFTYLLIYNFWGCEAYTLGYYSYFKAGSKFEPIWGAMVNHQFWWLRDMPHPQATPKKI